MLKLREEQVALMAKQFTAGAAVRNLTARGFNAERHEETHDVHLIDPAGNRTLLKIDDEGKISEGVTPLGRRFKYGYDSERRLNSITDPAGSTIFYKYDERNRIIEARRDSDRHVGLDWDHWGNLTTIAFNDQTFCQTTYRELDRFTSYTDRLSRTSQFDRNAAGLLTEITDPAGNRTQYEYERWNLPTQIKFADGSREAISYDSNGKLAAFKVNGEKWADLKWHPQGKLEAIRYADGHFVQFAYDAAGHVIEAKNPTSVVKRKFDDKNRLIEEEQNGHTVSYTYAPTGHLSAISTLLGGTVKFDYDADGRLSTVEDWNGGQHKIEYQGERTQLRHLPNGLLIRTETTALGLPADVHTAGFGHASEDLTLQFEYNENGQVLRMHDSDCGSRTLAYDAEGQLVAVQNFQGLADESYHYDLNGNRVVANNEYAAFDSVNQLVQQGAQRFTYDARGNLIEQTGPEGTVRFIYNGQHLLTAMKMADGRLIEFEYDAFARRIAKTCGGIKTHYLWAGDQLISEWTEGGAQPQRKDYLFTPGTHTPLSLRVNGAEVYQYHNDHAGVPRWLTDSQKKVAWSASYTAFGKAVVRADRLKQNLRMPGQYFDEETGLHYNRARYYSPALGRYLSRDPIQVVSNLNLYLYAGNDPVNGSDPLGLLGFWNAVIGGALIVGAVALAVVAAPLVASVMGAGLLLMGVGALAGAGVGVLMAPDNCPMCMLQAGLKGLAYGAGLGLMVAGLLIGGPPAMGGAAMAIAGGGMLATDAALLAGGATFATGALMVANANQMSGGGDGDGSNGQSQSEQTDAPTRPTREQALKDVYAEADKKGVKILTDADPEIKAYMDNAAARQGTEVHAITLGDDTIVVREEYANNIRVLREELIHTQQQTSGFPIDSSGDLTTQMELDARRQLLDNKDSWALTDDEVKEVQSEISTILQRGRY